MTKSRNNAQSENASVNLSDLQTKAHPVKEFTDVWVGSSPDVLGIDKDSKEKIELADLENQEIVILGYSKRKGDIGPFVICTFVVMGGNKANVFITGAQIIVRKMDEVAEQEGFPVSGRITIHPSKSFKGGHYFNFS